MRRQLQVLCYSKDRSASNSPPLDLTPKRSSECSTTCSTPPSRYIPDTHLYLSAFSPQVNMAAPGWKLKTKYKSLLRSRLKLRNVFQISMMPRFLNTMRLTQAIYETAASILVTVSTVKSFPALMTLPFVDQVTTKKCLRVKTHINTRRLFYSPVRIAPGGLARTVHFDGRPIFFGDRYLLTARRTQVQLWHAGHRRTNHAVQRHASCRQASASRSHRTIPVERNHTPQIR